MRAPSSVGERGEAEEAIWDLDNSQYVICHGSSYHRPEQESRLRSLRWQCIWFSSLCVDLSNLDEHQKQLALEPEILRKAICCFFAELQCEHSPLSDTNHIRLLERVGTGTTSIQLCDDTERINRRSLAKEPCDLLQWTTPACDGPFVRSASGPWSSRFL